MRVVDRDGNLIDVKFDKITERLEKLSEKGPWGNKLDLDLPLIVKEVCSLIHDGIKTTELDEFTASVAAGMFNVNPEYETLASRIIINNHIKNTDFSFSECIEKLYNISLISEDIFLIVNKNKEFINQFIIPERDYLINFFGMKSLQRAYLLKVDGITVERPQYLFLRVALGIHGANFIKVKETYDSLSLKFYTHATPTLFNAGTKYAQMSSCFLTGTEDSVEGIFKTISDVALISKWAGGVGIHISDIRAKNSYITKTGGKSDGIMPMLKVYNDVSRYINQSGKRNGSFAMYLEPWHADFVEFIEAKKNNGAEEIRARDLFYALWIPDLFMQRVEDDLEWSLMCPFECPGLTNCHSEEFVKLYEKYESEGKYREQIKAKKLWSMIIDSQIETGGPYILYKDSVNKKSNQQNIGIIKSSNLCTEIMEYSDNKETAVCNLASLCLPTFINNGVFNFDLLSTKVEELVYNLNVVIDKNFYPTIEAKNSNLRHRPIGIGVQGLADVFMILDLPYDSTAARALNRDIFEVIYYSAVNKSMQIAVIDGPYETFKGSPTSQGILQFDMWNIVPSKISITKWNNLKHSVVKYGIRNSLLVAPMPTASTAQIMGNNESFEPYTSNLYTRRVLAGEFVVINKHLIRKLKENGLWDQGIIEQLMRNKGSVQNLDIPDNIKSIFKTAWEISQKSILDMAIDRSPYICQSQSLNLFVETADPNIINSIHFYGWKGGLKTGSYYIRTKPILNTQSFTLEPEKPNVEKPNVEKPKRKVVCDELSCTMCSA